MGEYECINCNEFFWADEPPENKDICDNCKEQDNDRLSK